MQETTAHGQPHPWNHPSQKLHLGPQGVLPSNGRSFYRPMYSEVTEILDLLKIRFWERYRLTLEVVKTFDNNEVLESEWVPAFYVGFDVETYVVYEKVSDDRRLLLSVWPSLLANHKQIRYQIHTSKRSQRRLIDQYLEICARMNNANLLMQI